MPRRLCPRESHPIIVFDIHKPGVRSDNARGGTFTIIRDEG
jgi:hypothetical protein